MNTILRNTLLRKSLLSIAGLSITGGLIAGPVTTARATPPTAPTTAAAVATAGQPTTTTTASSPQGAQSHIDLTDEQTTNAKAIIAATKHNGLDQRAAVISIATALQESKLQNLGDLGDANDHDSLGLFQQRPTSGWGTPEQITNPEYATTAFQKALKDVPDWHNLPLTDAAQKVQVSAYPDAYAQWETQATDLVTHYWNS